MNPTHAQDSRVQRPEQHSVCPLPAPMQHVLLCCVNERARIKMTEEEILEHLRVSRKLQLATVNPDGTAHLVTMFYGLADGKITFWTYVRAQKTRNLERDPRVTCLIESGEHYFE